MSKKLYEVEVYEDHAKIYLHQDHIGIDRINKISSTIKELEQVPVATFPKEAKENKYGVD